MRILAIETVDLTGSVAALDGESVLAERTIEGHRRTARSLAPSLAELLREVGWQPGDVQLVAVAVGPGSFTGLRIGVTTAKAFAYATGCEIVEVDSMLAIASRGDCPAQAVVVVAEYKRSELFAAQFARDGDGSLQADGTTRIVSRADWIGSLSPGIHVTGTGLTSIFDALPPGIVAADASLWNATAAAVGAIGRQRFVAGERGDVFSVVPRYVRRAAAEEKLDPRRP